jgi:ATP/maltotriose-dependent transcriptional regulator MalT
MGNKLIKSDSYPGPTRLSVMHTVLLRAETKELDNPYRIPQLETEFKRYGETLDFRVNYHYVRGLLELAAASRSLGEYNQARRIISAANSLRESLNIDLLKADVLIEQANLAFAMGDAHLALAEVTQAQNLMNENGYGLHKQAVKELLDRVQVSHDPGAVNTIE